VPRLLMAAVRPWRGTVIFVAVVVLASAGLELIPPLVIRSVIDDHLSSGRADGLLLLGLVYLGALAAVQVSVFVYSYMAAWIAQRAINSLRLRLFTHLLRLPIRHHDTTPLGDMVSRCTADVETLETLFSSGVARLLADMVRLVTIAAAMVVLSPALSLVTLAVLPPLVLLTRMIQVRIRNAERASRLAVGRVNTELQESLVGVEVVRAFGRGDHFVSRFRRALGQVVLAYNQATRFNAIYPPATVFMSAVVVSLLLWTGGQNVFGSWGVSLGTLVAFVFLFQRFFAPITALGEEWQTVQSALAGAERIAEVLDVPAETPAAQASGAPDLAAPVVIEMRSADFGYETKPVVRDVTLLVKRGEHVAVVGRTGAGKSTVLSLLAGLHRPWSGSVTVLGIDPWAVTGAERRWIMGVVPQTVHLFAGTVVENLTLGDGSIDRDQVTTAAELSGADAFIRDLPDQYETLIDGSGREGGTQLSEGQRQLIGLARAVVLRPPVLLLDEATSAVDAASDSSFRAALRTLSEKEGTTVVTVAHRLATAREADRVLVMEAGRVVEHGTPAELVSMGGKFAAFIELEEAGWDWRRPEGAGVTGV
jgi:ATP-binding cassette subfamily B protein